MTSTDLLVLAKRYFKAYDDLNIAVMSELLADDVHWEHHNRFKGAGKSGLLESIERIAGLAPDRRFGPIKRSAGADSRLFVEHDWRCTPKEADVQRGWEAGKPFKMDVVSLVVVDQGRIVEWSDWG